MRFYLVLVAVNLYWGLTQVLIKHALLYMTSSTYTMLRFGTAAIALCLIMLLRRTRLKPETVLHGAVLGALVSGQTLLNSYSLYFTSTANSVFIAQLAIVAVPAFYMLRDRKGPSRHYLIAVACMLTGLIIFADIVRSGFNVGDLIVVLSMLTICGQVIIGARVTARDDLFQLAVVQMVSAALVSALVALPQGDISVSWTPESVAIIVLTGVIGSGVCNSIRLLGQKHVPPTAVSFINILHPVFAMIGAAIIPDALGNVEPIPSFKIWGSLIMIAGMMYYFYQQRDASKRYTREDVKSCDARNRT